MNPKLPFRCVVTTPIIALLTLVLLLSESVQADFSLPKEIADKVDVISTFDSKLMATPIEMAGYAEQQQVYSNLVGNALKPAGLGGVYEGKVLKVKNTFALYRVYTKKPNPQTGRNNRFGGWWTFAPPGKGITKADYRKNFEICESFNQNLDRVAECRIYPGALLLAGPGQSVDASICGNPGESYAADTGKQNLQIFLFQMYNHSFLSPDSQTPLKDTEHYVGCPPESADHSFEWYSQEREASN